MRPRRCGRSRGCRLDGKIGFYGAVPVVQPSGADQAAVTLGNTDGEIGGLSISDPPTQAEVQALRDKCEQLMDDVQALSTLVRALRGALVAMLPSALSRAPKISPPAVRFPIWRSLVKRTAAAFNLTGQPDVRQLFLEFGDPCRPTVNPPRPRGLE